MNKKSTGCVGIWLEIATEIKDKATISTTFCKRRLKHWKQRKISSTVQMSTFPYREKTSRREKFEMCMSTCNQEIRRFEAINKSGFRTGLANPLVVCLTDQDSHLWVHLD